MAVLVNGIEMPENCEACFCLNDEHFYCQAVGRKPKDENILQRRPDWCPLIYVPYHGRLIDADAFERDECTNCDGACETIMCNYQDCTEWMRCDIMQHIRDAETIIPSDKEDES